MLSGIVIFLLLLIALLAIPVTLTFQVHWRETFQSSIRLLWLFGLVRVRLPSFQSKALSSQAEEPRGKSSRVERSPVKSSNLFSIIWQKAFRQRMIRFMSDFWHAVRKRHIRLRIRVGLGDPADTGQLWAAVGPVAGMLATIQDASIEIEPEFFETTFELNSSGNIRLIPLQMIYLIVALLLSPAVWQGIGKMRTANR